MRQQPNWPAVRLAYVNGEGSLVDLSARFGVPKRTLERRCSHEGWRNAIDQAGGTVAAVAAEVAVQEGRRIGMTASDFLTRSIRLTEKFLAEIEERLDSGTLTTTEFRNLSASFREAVGVGRETFGLDSEPPAQMLHLHVMRAGPGTRVIDVDAEENALAIGG